MFEEKKIDSILGHRDKAIAWNDKMIQFHQENPTLVPTSIAYTSCLVTMINDSHRYKTEVEMYDMKTYDALLAVKEANPNKRVCLLNFASYMNPGGGFLKGANAQEESLCHTSDLYQVLLKEDTFYQVNRTTVNSGIYTNRAIYSKNVNFFKNINNDGPCKVSDIVKSDVVTCAATNLNVITDNYPEIYKWDIEDILVERIHYIMKIMAHHRPEILILGAYGCGAFGNDVRVVLKAFLNCLRKEYCGTFEKVIFAIPSLENGGNDINFKKSNRMIKDIKERGIL